MRKILDYGRPNLEKGQMTLNEDVHLMRAIFQNKIPQSVKDLTSLEFENAKELFKELNRPHNHLRVRWLCYIQPTLSEYLFYGE